MHFNCAASPCFSLKELQIFVEFFITFRAKSSLFNKDEPGWRAVVSGMSLFYPGSDSMYSLISLIQTHNILRICFCTNINCIIIDKVI